MTRDLHIKITGAEIPECPGQIVRPDYIIEFTSSDEDGA